MSLLSRLAAWIGALFRPAAPDRPPERARAQPPPVLFHSITFVDKPPRNDDIVKGQLYYVVNGSKPKWALFKCPCGCDTVITLSLQPVHQSHWRLTGTTAGVRPCTHRFGGIKVA